MIECVFLPEKATGSYWFSRFKISKGNDQVWNDGTVADHTLPETNMAPKSEDEIPFGMPNFDGRFFGGVFTEILGTHLG